MKLAGLGRWLLAGATALFISTAFAQVSPERIAALATTMASIEAVVDIPALKLQLADLESEASAPDLWDDQERAQQVTSRLSYAQGEVRRVETLRRRSLRFMKSRATVADRP